MKEKKILKGTNIFVGEDFSKAVRETRKKLQVIFKEKRSHNANVKMIHDHLLIDGKRFFLSADGESLVEEVRGGSGDGRQ